LKDKTLYVGRAWSGNWLSKILAEIKKPCTGVKEKRGEKLKRGVAMVERKWGCLRITRENKKSASLSRSSTVKRRRNALKRRDKVHDEGVATAVKTLGR